MKYSSIILVLLILACKTDRASSSTSHTSKTSEHIESKSNFIPKFEDFKVEEIIAKIDSQTLDKIYTLNKSHFEQFYYQRTGLHEYCKLFAGKYIAIDMSQGSETVITYMFDSQTGKMYESPLFMYSSEYRENSRLFIKDPILDETQKAECENGIFDCERKYYLWNEKLKQFIEIE